MIIENVIRYLLMPSNLINLLLLAGILSLIVFRLRKIAFFCWGLATLLYFVLGSGPVSYSLMSNLEYQYVKIGGEANRPDVSHIVLLGGYGEEDPLRPRSSQLNTSSVYRLIESLRLWNIDPENRDILVSAAGSVPGLIKELLVQTGVPDAQILVDNKSADTRKSIQFIKSRLGDEAFYLVTSAGHMPRAMKVAVDAELRAIAAPTDFRSKKNIFATSYLTTPDHLTISDQAIAEYLAAFRDRLWGLNHVSKSVE